MQAVALSKPQVCQVELLSPACSAKPTRSLEQFQKASRRCASKQQSLTSEGLRCSSERRAGGREWATRVAPFAQFPVHAAQKGEAVPSTSANGEEEEWEDLNEDELDELIAAHGEVVYSDSAAGPDVGALEDSEAFALAVAALAADTKAVGVRILRVKPLVYWTEFFVIMTSFSRPQSDAIRKRVQDMAAESFHRAQSAGDKEASNTWTLLDYGDVVVHIFSPRDREFYNLEDFYGNAEEVEWEGREVAQASGGRA